MKRFPWLLCGIVLILLGTLDRGFCQPSLKVGTLIPFAGRWGDSARECAKGMLDAGKWINVQGGVFGRKLELQIIEDTSQTAELLAAYRKLNEADHISLLHIYSTETALLLLSHIQFHRTPTLVGTLPAHLTNPAKYPFLFSIVPTPLDLSKIAITYIAERSDIKVRKPKVIFVGSPEYIDRHFLEEVKTYAYASGLEVGPDVSISEFPQPKLSPSAGQSGLTSSAFLPTIKRYNPDFVYLSLTPREAVHILQEVKDLGLKTKWIGNTRAFDETLTPFEGVLGVQPFAPFGEDLPGMVEIKEVHQRWHPYDTHTLSYTEGWATVQVMAEALRRSLPEERFSDERMKGSLESFRNYVLGGIIPPITITPQDHRPSVEARIFMVKQGKLLPQTTFLSVGKEGKLQ